VAADMIQKMIVPPREGVALELKIGGHFLLQDDCWKLPGPGLAFSGSINGFRWL